MSKKCSIEGCHKKHMARSWCTAHYYAWVRHGDPLYVRQFKKDEKCIVEGCERKQQARGYCATHSAKLRRSGTLEPIRATPEYKRRWLELRITDVSKLDGIRDPKRRGFLATNLISDLRQKSRQRGIEWILTSIEAYNLVKSKCYYCGYLPNWPETRCGIDRVDNLKGYKSDNVVSCCYTCNTAKGTKSLEEFRNWAVSLSENFLRSLQS